MHDYGWNPVTQVFDVKSVPKEIKNILQKVGIGLIVLLIGKD